MGKPVFFHIDLQPDRIRKMLSYGTAEVRLAFAKALESIHEKTSMEDLRRDHGLRWEKLTDQYFPGTNHPIYTFRITGNWRARCMLHSGPVIEIVTVSDHDEAY